MMAMSDSGSDLEESEDMNLTTTNVLVPGLSTAGMLLSNIHYSKLTDKINCYSRNNFGFCAIWSNYQDLMCDFCMRGEMKYLI